ncbi:hypothetical protein B0T09DRAFT_332318 [Sordaria sp. MPI-SDFR-AT-0083]|nr:hypothetical protein B0T09DRAFT_332318 [Sordaria sp. MPI-SDFR-AT-0083]
MRCMSTHHLSSLLRPSSSCLVLETFSFHLLFLQILPVSLKFQGGNGGPLQSSLTSFFPLLRPLAPLTQSKSVTSFH